ncbi:MAG TPA: hypothetical protein VM487_02840 [Phycisphaerae bacterium]|nr:hypothetical protein [Phycisphaerae bacterium]
MPSDTGPDQSSPRCDGPYAPIEAKIGRVGAHLCRSLRHVLAAVPGAPRRPVELSRALRVNHDLASKTLLATSKPDPLAAAHSMPGPEALRTLLKAARRRKIDKALIAVAEEAVREFESLLRDDVGSRAELDAVLSAWLPEARRRFEASNKQLAFKANCNLKGVVAEVGLTAVLFHPADDQVNCDAVGIMGRMGLRRLRPGVPICFSARHSGPKASSFAWETLEGARVDFPQSNVLLNEFCSQPMPKLEISMADDAIHYRIARNGIGPKSAVNVFLAQVVRNALDRYRRPEAPRRKGVGTEVEIPTKTMVLDVLLHESVWPGCPPELVIYDTVIRGRANVNDQSRLIDRMDLSESIQFLGQGTARFRIAEVPNYVELIRNVCDKLGWASEKFRGYRCRISYPFYGSQVSMVFDLPNPPAE